MKNCVTLYYPNFYFHYLILSHLYYIILFYFSFYFYYLIIIQSFSFLPLFIQLLLPLPYCISSFPVILFYFNLFFNYLILSNIIDTLKIVYSHTLNVTQIWLWRPFVMEFLKNWLFYSKNEGFLY